MSEKKDDFLQIGGDSNFQDRSNAIFGCLDKLEPEQKAEKSETESKPLGPRAPKRVPDHVLHPEKWTKYSLENDGSENNTGMTGDALNRQTALSFIEEIRKRKENTCKSAELESDVVMAEKHVFSRSAIKHKMEVDEELPRSQIVEGVNIMPEYVVGQSPAKTPKRQAQQAQSADKTKHSPQKSPGDGVCLEHLEEQETVEITSENTKEVSGSAEEQKERATFAKRKVKARGRLREHKSSVDDDELFMQL